ncbi:hypothetical protein PBV87_12910 [Niameybacter massiliensis]|uniref:Phage tail tape measure protein n=1 Tax=Holtiella tumoricola TaxID=3018743 RepID=A0AA42DNN4_9FIRM|nr:hypothetical protein [Holtiella tumoricola]
MASKKELQALITLAGKVDPSLQNALSKATKGTKDLGESMQESSKHASRLGDIIKGSVIGNMVYDGIRTVTNYVKQLGTQALETASSLIEVQNVVDTTFSSSAIQIDAWSKTTLKAFGITELQAKQWSGSMGAMLKSSGIAADDMLIMSKTLAELAGDFSSFYNLSHEDAWNKVRAGMSGETEPLKQLGINMSVANLEAYALGEGIKKSYKDMTQAEQTLLRYNYLLEMSTDAQGDFARTLDTSWENQKRLLKNNIMDKASAVLAKFIPLLTDLTAKANAFVEQIDIDMVILNIENGFRLAGDAVGWMKDNIDWIIPTGLTLAGVMTSIKAINIIRSISETVAWVGKLTSFTKLLTLAKIKDKAETLYLMALYSKDAVVKGISTAGTWAMTAAQGALNGIMAIGTGIMGAFGAVLAFVTSPIGLVVLGIAALIAVGVALWKNWDTVKVKAFELWEGMKSAFGGIGEWFGGLWEGVKEGFKGFVNFIIGGINRIPEGINKIQISVPDWVPGLGGKTLGFNIPTIPTFAMGGIATQASIFGEAGPEMAIPLKRTPRSIHLLNQTAEFLGVNKSVTEKVAQKVANIVINVTGDTSKQSILDIKEAVKQALQELEYEEEVVSFG